MGNSADDSVVDSFGRVHGVPNLYVAGASTFAGTSGAVPPTLTIAATALRTAAAIAAQLDATKMSSGPSAIGRSSKQPQSAAARTLVTVPALSPA